MTKNGRLIPDAELVEFDAWFEAVWKQSFERLLYDMRTRMVSSNKVPMRFICEAAFREGQRQLRERGK